MVADGDGKDRETVSDDDSRLAELVSEITDIYESQQAMPDDRSVRHVRSLCEQIFLHGVTTGTQDCAANGHPGRRDEYAGQIEAAVTEMVGCACTGTPGQAGWKERKIRALAGDLIAAVRQQERLPR